jgi:hypothetical protein
MLRGGRGRVALSLMLVIGAVAGLATAQTRGGDSPTTPESGVRGVGLPKAPFVDFCPTPEQVEQHMQVYGFDYKPTVACNREGEFQAQTPEQGADAAQDPDEGLSAAETCKLDKTHFLSAKPLPDRDGDAAPFEGVLPDGREIVVQVFADPASLKGQTLRDLANVLPC